MFTTLYAIEVAASVAIAVCAVIAALGRRRVPALCGLAAAFLGYADALTDPGHRNWWGAVVLLLCGAALLTTAVVVAFRRKRAAATCPCDGCRTGVKAS